MKTTPATLDDQKALFVPYLDGVDRKLRKLKSYWVYESTSDLVLN